MIVQLTVDQFEAINLADLEGLDQSEGAVIMGISRSSFGRILRAAHRIIADALINGKIIKIGIGDVQVGVRPVKVDFLLDPMRKVSGDSFNASRLAEISPGNS